MDTAAAVAVSRRARVATSPERRSCLLRRASQHFCPKGVTVGMCPFDQSQELVSPYSTQIWLNPPRLALSPLTMARITTSLPLPLRKPTTSPKLARRAISSTCAGLSSANYGILIMPNWWEPSSTNLMETSHWGGLSVGRTRWQLTSRQTNATLQLSPVTNEPMMILTRGSSCPLNPLAFASTAVRVSATWSEPAELRR